MFPSFAVVAGHTVQKGEENVVRSKGAIGRTFGIAFPFNQTAELRKYVFEFEKS